MLGGLLHCWLHCLVAPRRLLVPNVHIPTQPRRPFEPHAPVSLGAIFRYGIRLFMEFGVYVSTNSQPYTCQFPNAYDTNPFFVAAHHQSTMAEYIKEANRLSLVNSDSSIGIFQTIMMRLQSISSQNARSTLLCHGACCCSAINGML